MDCPSDPDEILILPEVKVETPSVHLATQQIVDFSNFEEVQIKEEFIIDDQQHQTDLLHLPKQKKDVNLDITEVKTDLQKNQEYSSLTTNLSDSQNNEEFELSRDIENETETDQRTQDHQSELLDVGFKYFVEVNVASKELKTQQPEQPTTKKTTQKKQTKKPPIVGEDSNMLNCCKKCNAIWQHIPNGGNACRRCLIMPSAYKCKRCMKHYKYLNSLRSHVNSSECCVSLKPRLSCEYCEHKACTPKALLHHIESKHLSRHPTSNKCLKCGETFSWKRELLRHERICEQLTDLFQSSNFEHFTCYYCGYETNLKFNLAFHILVKHLLKDPDSNTCSICDKTFATRTSLWKHFKVCIEPVYHYYCNHCEFKTIHKQSLYCHNRAKHRGTGFRFVDVTDIVNEFKSENQTSQETKNQLPKDSDSGLLNKIKTEEQAENKKELFQYTGRVDEKYMLHYCDACKKSWKYVSTYSPCSVCHKMSKYMCSRCLKPYKRLNSLRMHLDYLCRGKFIPCEYCRHKAISLSALRQHIEEEHLSDNSDSSNECEKCGETFSWRRELLRHEKLCDQLRASYKLEKLTCDDCGYVTTDKFNLAYHILRVHYLNNTNLNKCNICDKVSMRRGDLLKHYKRCGQFSCYHFCNQCEFKTVYVQNLRKHKINKHS